MRASKGGPPMTHRADRQLNTRYDPRADKITVAITEAIIASHKGITMEHPSF